MSKSQDKPAPGGGTAGDDPAAKVKAGGWTEDKPKARRRTFPGPAGAAEALRVAVTRDAYAEVTAHAKESLNAEVCGVLVGELCEDDAGPFVSVEAAIRGTAARTGSTHVTFTQETWNQIHKEKDRQHPKKQIVGWYHTHPGFGVEFSEMDLFIQRNFFSGASQIAFVTDPLGGQEAILVNAGGGIVPVSRFWVDGREKRCSGIAPAGAGDFVGGGGAAAASEGSIRALEDRIGQLMQMVDAQATSMHRFLFTVGMVVAVGVCIAITYFIWTTYAHENRPPEVNSFVPVPVQIGDKSVLLGVAVVKWEVPPSLNAAFIQLERERQAAEEAKRKAQAATAPASAPASGPSAAPATAATTGPATAPAGGAPR